MKFTELRSEMRMEMFLEKQLVPITSGNLKKTIVTQYLEMPATEAGIGSHLIETRPFQLKPAFERVD
jgi:hypothetical protein